MRRRRDTTHTEHSWIERRRTTETPQLADQREANEEAGITGWTARQTGATRRGASDGVESRERKDGRAVRKRDGYNTQRRNEKKEKKLQQRKRDGDRDRERHARAAARSEARDSTDLCVREVE